VIPQAVLQPLDRPDRRARIEREQRHQRLAGVAGVLGGQPKIVQRRGVGTARSLPAPHEVFPALRQATGHLLADVAAGGHQPPVPECRLQALQPLAIRHGSRVFPERGPCLSPFFF